MHVMCDGQINQNGTVVLKELISKLTMLKDSQVAIGMKVQNSLS